MPLPDDLLATIEGFLSLPEATLLHDMAASCPSGSNIVEIGAYRGRSTVSLALGAKEAGAILYSVDSHPTYEAGGTQYSMVDNQAYYANIAHYGVGDVVRTVNLPSVVTWSCWDDKIALLFIDGSHDYLAVRDDFKCWSEYADTVLMHDTVNNFHPGVTRLLNEVLAAGEFECAQVVDSLSILKRVK